MMVRSAKTSKRLYGFMSLGPYPQSLQLIDFQFNRSSHVTNNICTDKEPVFIMLPPPKNKSTTFV